MAGPAYQFGPWRFEPTECRLLRDGVVVPLPAKTLDLLATLLRRAPRLVTKEEILAAVWADAVVEEGNIAFHVAALRKVLDEAGGQSAIETVRGRGYRFVQEVAIHQLPPTDHLTQAALARAGGATTATSATATPATPIDAIPAPVSTARHNRTMVLLLAIAALCAIGLYAWTQSRPKWSIAVEPFEIVNPAPGEENFPDGLRTYLTSKMQLSGIALAQPDAATAVLSGQLHPENGGFRVTVQLTRAGDGVRVWNWSFDVPRDIDKPPASAGPDDERSRLQAAIAVRASEGVRNYLSLSPAAAVTR